MPALLAKWQPGPAVRLAWCRVHNGEFVQPRRSEGYVAVSAVPDLIFLGRAEDSLYFEVTGSAALAPGYGSDADGSGNGDPSPPGFRYDLPTDQAVALPQALEPPAPQPSTYPGGLLSYPFFAYDEPGTRLFPASWFSTVAGRGRGAAGALRLRTRAAVVPARVRPAPGGLRLGALPRQRHDRRDEPADDGRLL